MNKKKITKGLVTIGTVVGTAFAGMEMLAWKKRKQASEDKDLKENVYENAGKPVIYVKENIYEKYLKRGLDVAMSFSGLIVLAPLYAGIALAIVIDDPGPVLFTQKRVGQDKTYYKLHKFRSMKMSTPHDMPTHLLENPDQYITKVGRILRKYSLDELPQIWDIFIGNLTIIGPRPALWNQNDLVAERDRYGANDVKPGLTGWAQINGRDELEIPVKARFDGEYVRALKKGSISGFLMDIKCFFGTIRSVADADGVVEGGTGQIHQQEESLQKRKYLIITNHSYMLWQFRRELIEELQKTGEVVISTPFVGHENDFAEMGCRMINTELDRRGINPKEDLQLYAFYKKMLKKEKPDMVITYSIKPNVYAGYACRKLKIPYCVNVQGLGTAFQKEPIASLVTLMYKVALKKAKTVFFENTANAEEFVKRGILPPSQQTVLHGAGVNLEFYQKQPYPSEKDGIHFLFLGRIMKEKGVDELFTAAIHLKGKYGEQVHFDLVGFFEDEYKETVERLVKEGIVTFHGFQSDPKPFYKSAHCVVLPSYHEGMSNVLLEAAATGRTVITSDIPGCREAVEDGKTGYLCRKQDAESLEKVMQKFLNLDETARQKMGELGRIKIEREFDKRAVVEKTARMIRN